MASLNFLSVTVSGADYIWSTPANWDAGQVPVDSDQVTMTAGSPNLNAYTAQDDIASLTLDNLNIGNSVTFNVAASADLEVQALANSGSIEVDGTFFVHNINSNNGTVDVRSGGSLEVGNLSGQAFVIETGGTLQLDSGGNINGTPTFFLHGGLLNFENNTGGNTTVDFSGGSAGHLSITTQQVTNNNSPSLANLGAGDSIELGDATASAVSFDSATSTLTITANGTDYNIHISSFDGTGNSFELATDPTTGRADAMVVCYLRGTRLRVRDGEVAVEDLRPGDAVSTLDPAGGEIRQEVVKWIGSRRIDLGRHPAAHTVAPVLIRANAFADGVPSRDLRLSPDHGVLVDGMLVCARQLVNGASIVQESGHAAIEYFHVELDRHGILLAEGLAAESYLDTGNRSFFDNAGMSFVLHPNLVDESDYATREAASCVPFVWDEMAVRPVWQRLSERSVGLGLPVTLPETTANAELSVVVAGRTLRPTFNADDRFGFVLPAGVTEVHLVSRAAMPTDAKPWLEDRRLLGVYIKRITLRDDGGDVLDIPLDYPALRQGWWAVEHDGETLCRWTTGDAVLPLPAGMGVRMLELRVGTSAYPLAKAA